MPHIVRVALGALRPYLSRTENATDGPTPMNPIIEILRLLLDVAFFIMIVHIIFSWLISFQVLNLYQPLVRQIWDGLNRLLEPIYGPIRSILPATPGLDLAPLVAFIILIAIRIILQNNVGLFL